MKNKFLYLILILFTVYIEIMYDHSQALLFLGFEILLYASMFVLSFCLKRQLKVSVSGAIPVVSKGQSISLHVVLENTGRLPVSRAGVNLVFENSFGDDAREERVCCGVNGKEKIQVERKIPARYCGRKCIHLEDFRVQDYLGLFTRKIHTDAAGYVNVLPDIYPMSVEVGINTRNFPVDGEEYDPHRSGDDPSEIFQIRDYRPGDGMQRIHWKMSAKAGELMTKEYGLPIGCSVLLLIDLCQPKKQKIEAVQMDRIMETAASISYSLMLEGCIHYAAWFDEKSQKVRRIYIKEEEQVYEMIDLLFGAFPYTEHLDLEEAYHARYPEGRYAAELRLDTGLWLWKNKERYLAFSDGEVKDIFPNMRLEL